jgi:hypothetical protein
MSEIKDGGPAFPQLSELGDIAYTTGGMTLRDYMAAKAMQGELCCQDHEEINYQTDQDLDGLAKWAYRAADAMLRARGE